MQAEQKTPKRRSAEEQIREGIQRSMSGRYEGDMSPLRELVDSGRRLWDDLLGLDKDIPYEDCQKFLELFKNEFSTLPRIDHSRTTKDGRCAHVWCAHVRRVDGEGGGSGGQW